MNFQEFKEDMVDLGATAYDHGNGHWQVKVGPATINFYPESKNKTIYVNKVRGFNAPMRAYQGDVKAVKLLVKEIQSNLTKEKSNDTSTSTS